MARTADPKRRWFYHQAKSPPAHTALTYVADSRARRPRNPTQRDPRLAPTTNYSQRDNRLPANKCRQPAPFLLVQCIRDTTANWTVHPKDQTPKLAVLINVLLRNKPKQRVLKSLLQTVKIAQQRILHANIRFRGAPVRLRVFTPHSNRQPLQLQKGRYVSVTKETKDLVDLFKPIGKNICRTVTPAFCKAEQETLAKCSQQSLFIAGFRTGTCLLTEAFPQPQVPANETNISFTRWSQRTKQGIISQT